MMTGAEVNHQSRNIFPDQWLTFRLASPHHEDARIESRQTKGSQGFVVGFVPWLD